MNSNPDILVEQLENDFVDSLSATEQIIEFYEKAGMDYTHWSSGFNMHLGFYRSHLNPLNREKMLEQMNIEIAKRLKIDLQDNPFLIDLGCGTGAVSRTIAKNYSNAIIKGVTIVPSHVELASKLNKQENLNEQIEIIEGDYTNLPFANGLTDGVWAVESACHAEGRDKKNLIREMARVLKSGGRFAIADCFIKQPEKEFNILIKRSYESVCDYWAVPEMPVLESFVESLQNEGFQEILVEDISWRVAPSLAHAPLPFLVLFSKKCWQINH